MKTRLAPIFITTIVIAAAAGLFLLWQTRSPAACPLCHREIHAASRTVIEIRGERKVVCCIRCAITAETQEGAPAKLLEVSDFSSGKPLRPQSAWYVANAPVVLCDQHQSPMDEHKQPLMRVYDRCEPSIFAFSTAADASSFAARQGGEVARLDQIMRPADKRR